MSELRPIDWNGHCPEPTNADLADQINCIQAALETLIGEGE